MPLKPRLLTPDRCVPVVEQNPMWEYEADTAAGPLVIRRLPDEAKGELAIGNRQAVFLTPGLSRRARSLDTCPRGITHNQVKLIGELGRWFEEVSAKDRLPRCLSCAFVRGKNQAREHLTFSLQLLDVRRGELVEKGEVQTEGCNATCGWTQVKAKEILPENRHEGSGTSIILGVRVLTFPFFR